MALYLGHVTCQSSLGGMKDLEGTPYRSAFIRLRNHPLRCIHYSGISSAN